MRTPLRFGPALFAVAAVLLVAGPVFAQTSAVMGAPSPATNISQQFPPICPPQATSNYLQYNVARGQWQCVATQSVTKLVTGMRWRGAAATALTVTVPNTTINAILHVRVFASPGPGGSVAAFECTLALEANIAIARTAGVLTVVNAGTATMTASACVAGAATPTLTYAASTVAGGVGGTDTFTVTVTLTQATEASDNHQAVVIADLKNNVNAGAAVAIQ